MHVTFPSQDILRAYHTSVSTSDSRHDYSRYNGLEPDYECNHAACIRLQDKRNRFSNVWHGEIVE